MLDLIASVLVRGLSTLLYFTPIRLNLWLGRRIGILAYLLSGNRKHITYANLKAAFCGEKSTKEIKRITKDAYRNMVQIFVELLSFKKVDRQYLEKFVKVTNPEYLEEALNSDRGIVFLSAHFGNWELGTAKSSARGCPLHLIARDQKMKRLNELLNLLRESKGNIVIRKGADIKNVFRVLHQGKGVGMLADQNAGAHGILIDFFGRPASTVVGPYRFAQKSGAVILTALVHREEGPYHRIVLGKPMTIGKKEDVTPYMARYNDILEENIRVHPDQWLWMHKRWKLTPLKKVLVLNDGKKGHLNQSLAVVEEIKKYRRDEGYKEEHLKVDVVNVKFRNDLRKGIFRSLTPLVNSNCQGRLMLLKFALDKETFRDITGRYADVIVSCGSSLSGINKVLKKENYARNITVLDPGALNRKAFDVIVIPRHDVEKRHSVTSHPPLPSLRTYGRGRQSPDQKRSRIM
ncbi:MAG: lysophospholipid acyltransferase family protein [Candidatus Omnitrophota bacterium]